MAEPADSTLGVDDPRPSIERAKMILTELAGAAQSAVWSVVDAQRARAAAQVGGVAAAARAAARSFERSQAPAAARCTDAGASQIEALAQTIRARHWADLAADVEGAARRRPALFVAGAVALGFLAGRLLSAGPRRTEPAPQTGARAAEDTVAAAVASASGNGGIADWPPAAPARELL